MENGHTLHLVARQPPESQASSGTSNVETNASNGTRGIDSWDILLAS